MPVIEVKDLHKIFRIYSDKPATLKERVLFRRRRAYEKREVLKGISFTVEKGETVGLIGHNGCGKSTLLKLLTKILYPDEGSVTVKGRVSSLIELGAGFHPDLTGRENIYANAAIFGLKKKEVDRRLNDIISFSELEEFIDTPVRTYSSGMYTRLAFSVAINVDADILLVDEILAVGDTNFQKKCYKKMRRLRDGGMTIILVTHSDDTVKTFCSRAIWINNGKIVADGDTVDTCDKYLAFMDKKRLQYQKKEEEERGKKQESGEKADQKELKKETEKAEQDSAENTKKPTEEKTENEIDSNHFGNKEVVITKCCLSDKDGNEVEELVSGEKYFIDMYYKINKENSMYNFGMAFFTMDNRCVYGTNMHIDNIYKREMPKEGKVSFEMEEFPLLTGEYKLSVAIINEEATPLDYYKCYCTFYVNSKEKCIGTSNVKHKWIFEGKDV